jgi:hypothetical protein
MKNSIGHLVGLQGKYIATIIQVVWIPAQLKGENQNDYYR